MFRYIHVGVLFSVLTFLLILWGCGSKSLAPQSFGQMQLDKPVTINDQVIGGQESLNLVLRSSSDSKDNGSAVRVEVCVEGALDLKQASLRLLYKRKLFSPVRIDPGAVLPGSALFVSSLTAEGGAYKNATSDTGVLPIAFTVLPGEQGITGDGVLAEIELESLQPGSDNQYVLSVLEVQDYLLFIDEAGKSIPVEISYEGGSNE